MRRALSKVRAPHFPSCYLLSPAQSTWILLPALSPRPRSPDDQLESESSRQQRQASGFVLLLQRCDGLPGSSACSPLRTSTGPSTPATHSGLLPEARVSTLQPGQAASAESLRPALVLQAWWAALQPRPTVSDKGLLVFATSSCMFSWRPSPLWRGLGLVGGSLAQSLVLHCLLLLSLEVVAVLSCLLPLGSLRSS